MYICCIDDDRDVLDQLNIDLELLGFSGPILNATDLQEVQVILKDHPHEIELFICDLVLEKQSGFDMINAIREKKNYERTAILMLSGMQGSEVIVQTIKHGVNHYLLKPYSLEGLASKIIHAFKT
jgi:two-component system, chemotaxis family, chemotaxis protein CheY